MTHIALKRHNHLKRVSEKDQVLLQPHLWHCFILDENINIFTQKLCVMPECKYCYCFPMLDMDHFKATTNVTARTRFCGPNFCYMSAKNRVPADFVYCLLDRIYPTLYITDLCFSFNSVNNKFIYLQAKLMNYVREQFTFFQKKIHLFTFTFTNFICLNSVRHTKNIFSYYSVMWSL